MWIRIRKKMRIRHKNVPFSVKCGSGSGSASLVFRVQLGGGGAGLCPRQDWNPGL